MKQLFLLFAAVLAVACSGPDSQPLATSTEVPAASLSTQEGALTNGYYDVILVDDGRVSRDRAAHGFATFAPVRISYFHSADDAMQAYLAWWVDAIFIEWHQWGYKTTAEFIQYVRGIEWDPFVPTIPIVVVSEDPDMEAAALAAGADYFIHKVQSPEVYGNVLQHVLTVRPPVTEPL